MTLAAPCLLEVALLDRRQRVIDDDETGAVVLGQLADLLDLALAEQRRRARRGKRHQQAVGDVEVDRLCQPDGFLPAILRRVQRG